MIRNSDRALYVKLSDQVLFIIAKHWKIIKCPIVGEWLHKSLTGCNVSTRNHVYKRHEVVEKYVRWSGNHLTPFERYCLGWELIPHSWAPLAGIEDPLGVLPVFLCSLTHSTLERRNLIDGGVNLGTQLFLCFFYFMSLNSENSHSGFSYMQKCCGAAGQHCLYGPIYQIVCSEVLSDSHTSPRLIFTKLQSKPLFPLHRWGAFRISNSFLILRSTIEKQTERILDQGSD